jgi:DnaJ-class molecular chaperone
MGVRACQHCHGNGRITVWNEKKKTYETQNCPACGGSGKVDTRTV